VHFSVEVESEDSVLNTHQVVSGPNGSSTEIVTVDDADPGTLVRSKTVEFPTADNAIARQEALRAQGDLGQYDAITNSCVSHVCDVLEAGGLTVPSPNGSAQLKFLLGLFRKG
jgi:hypothetical protein